MDNDRDYDQVISSEEAISFLKLIIKKPDHVSHQTNIRGVIETFEYAVAEGEINNPYVAKLLLQLYRKACRRTGLTTRSSTESALNHMHATAKFIATAEIFCKGLQEQVPKKDRAKITALHK